MCPNVVLLCSAFLVVLDAAAQDDGSQDPTLAPGFAARTIVVNQVPRRYAIWLPPDYDPAKAWPLIVYLHGAGERGMDGVRQTTAGIGPALVQWPERFPGVVLLPQCPYGSVWKSEFPVVDGEFGKTLREYNIDKHRIYLTGNSLGGFGSWSYAALRPDLFAAMMPICGAGSADDVLLCSGIPTWVFTSRRDTIVPVQLVRWSVLIARFADSRVRYTEYPIADHDAWTPTYSSERVIAWLFHQSRSDNGQAQTPGPSDDMAGDPDDHPGLK